MLYKIYNALLLTITIFNCKAQSPILPLDSIGWRNNENTYYKDVNNTLNNFEGTWLFTNNNTSLKIILVKSTQNFNGNYYEDLLTGGYQYIENGIEKVNTLSDANDSSIGRNASIRGNNIYNNCKYLPVEDCTDGEKRLNLSIEDPNMNCYIGDLVLHKREVDGQEALKIRISMNYYCDDPSDGNYPSCSIPTMMNDIVLYKQ